MRGAHLLKVSHDPSIIIIIRFCKNILQQSNTRLSSFATDLSPAANQPHPSPHPFLFLVLSFLPRMSDHSLPSKCQPPQTSCQARTNSKLCCSITKW
ncbi:hypothetical protein BGZ61DRAFT_75076 [Ilyonectria robusta]|uniref:uncharacterized protein n=1 Tax=Ilyonectria robusta TaxID=1079257 RepID=UPI001E8EE1FF|nr:uncharacterized protein BGZ61DRAFT_75076 [Ilyonectria robusta]KAH8677128.1 hypothetical protein BGZ61DRAFT_75076 [Ilyonectria robusta]